MVLKDQQDSQFGSALKQSTRILIQVQTANNALLD